MASKIPSAAKVGGRPKIPWTSSRKRKLARLYLVTDLTIAEIRSALTVDGFAPGYVQYILFLHVF